jgi:hypothetical protein
MFDKLTTVESRYEELMARVGTVEVQADPAEFKKARKALSELEPLVEKFREYKGLEQDIAGAEELAKGSDAEMRELAEEELKTLTARREVLLAELKVLLIPKDPNDEKNVLLEVRAGTGGDEAALFAGDLFRMYTRYAERQGWKLDVLSSSDTGGGGLKEAIVSIEGRGVYSRLKYESGVHRCSACRPRKPAAASTRPRNGRGAARSRGRRHSDQREGPAHRHVLLERSRRSEREHHVFCGAAHAHSNRRGGLAAGREVTDQESREGDEGAARPSLRNGDAEAAGRHRQGSPQPGGHRRTLREDPHLQLPAEPYHRPSHQLHDASAPRRARRRHQRAARSGVVVLQRAKAQGSHHGRFPRSRVRRSTDAAGSVDHHALSLHDRLTAARAQLVSAGIAPAEAAVDVPLFACTILGWDRVRLLTERGAEAPAALEPTFSHWIARRIAREPAAYIVGVREFWASISP